jgi:hypothetical protein
MATKARRVAPVLLAAGALLLARAAINASDGVLPDAARLEAMAARYAPVDLGADVEALPAGERQALARLVDASRVLDTIFLRQSWSGNETLLLDLVRDESRLGKARFHYFFINKGPWSRLDHNASFVAGVPEKPPGGSFYPPGATKEEVEAWFKSLPDAERARAQGFYTTIRRGPDGQLRAVDFSVEYQGELAIAADRLRAAAAATSEPTLKAFLEKRATAFLTNDYYESDVAWMELDSAIEPTIGPYEVYEDEWFSFKASFEAVIALRVDGETRKLQRFASELQDLEDHLPMDAKLRNPKLGGLAPIRVVDLVFASGDGNRGVQTVAYNLPNDERVVTEKGSKRVMLRNTQRANFDTVLVPISRVALAAADQAEVSFDAFFTHVLMHELVHGIGPQNVTVGGKKSTVRKELKETYSVLEEAKADIVGLWALQRLVDRGLVDRSFERTMYTTFLASGFRSIRFGVGEAHGRGVAIQVNALLDKKAFKIAADGTFSVDRARIKDAVAAVSRQILTIQGTGDYAAAKQLLEREGVVRPVVQKVLDRLADVPVDIEPRFVTADELTRP